VACSSTSSLQCGPRHGIFPFGGPRSEKVGHPCSLVKSLWYIQLFYKLFYIFYDSIHVNFCEVSLGPGALLPLVESLWYIHLFYKLGEIPLFKLQTHEKSFTSEAKHGTEFEYIEIFRHASDFLTLTRES